MMRESLMGVTVAAVLASITLVSNATGADRTTRACIGESQCPVSVTSMFPCGTTRESAAASICTVHLGDGTKKVLPHTIAHQGTHGGGKCGYAWFLVTCLSD